MRLNLLKLGTYYIIKARHAAMLTLCNNCTPLSFEAPRHEIPTNICVNLIPSESRVPGQHILPLIIWIHLFSDFPGDWYNRVHDDRLRSSKFNDFRIN